MTPRCGIVVAVVAIACLVQDVSSLAPYYAAMADADRVEKGKYIVVLKDDEDTTLDSTSFVNREFRSGSGRQLSSSSYEIEHIYDHAISGFSATLTDDLREQMRNLPEVKYIEEVVPVFTQCRSEPQAQPQAQPQQQPQPQTQPKPPPSWGLDRIDQRDLPLDNNGDLLYRENGGLGVHMYIVDSGVRETHKEFEGRFSKDGFNHFNGTRDGFGEDCDGHGTHVAGIAAGATYGVAPKATIHSVRVYSCTKKGGTDSVLKGIDWIGKHHVLPAVVSMSIGGSKSEALNDAVEKLIGMGIVVSISAGNQNSPACNKSPASAPNVITVAATNINDERYDRSNYGVCVDIFAPGVDITSAWKDSDNATMIETGTSMACPHVSGVAAILLGRDATLSPAEIKAKLIALSTADKVIDSRIMRVTPNRLLYIGCGSSQFQCRIGKCIYSNWLCDGDNDCGDNSDETHSSCSQGCGSGKYQCWSGKCIYSNWLCDGDNDCGDNSDETHSSCPQGCGSSQFRCRNGHCVYNSWLCDGDNDCGDNSDETHSLC